MGRDDRLSQQPDRAGEARQPAGGVRLSLRAMLIFVLLCALSLAYFVVWPVSREKEATTRLQGIGAQLITADQRPAWVQTLLREVPTTMTTAVDLSGTAVTDAELVHLRGFPRLGGLILDRTAIGNAGMAEVVRAKELVQLSLSQTRITDFRLDGLGRLQDLNLSGNHFDSLSLAGLGELTSLDLRSSNIAEHGLGSLKELAALERLDLRDTRVSDADLAALDPLSKLNTIYLYNTQVTDRGVEALRRSHPGLTVAR